MPKKFRDNYMHLMIRTLLFFKWFFNIFLRHTCILYIIQKKKKKNYQCSLLPHAYLKYHSKKKKKLSMFPSATLCHSKYLYVSMFSSTTTRVLSPSFPRSSIGPSRMSMPNGRLLFHCLVGSWRRVLSAAPQRI